MEDKVYYNKHLGFTFYTCIEFDDDGTYRFWICDSKKRICDYYSSDVIMCLAEENKVDEEEMRNIIIEDLQETTDFITFMDSFCTNYGYAKNDIDTILHELELEEDYKYLTIDEKIKKWYEENDFSNIFGNYLVQLY